MANWCLEFVELCMGGGEKGGDNKMEEVQSVTINTVTVPRNSNDKHFSGVC